MHAKDKKQLLYSIYIPTCTTITNLSMDMSNILYIYRSIHPSAILSTVVIGLVLQ